MRISSQAHYGLEAGIILAKNYPHSISASELEKQIGVSKKYLEKIMRELTCAGIIKANRGAMGGYLLTTSPDEISVGVIVRALENDLKIVECITAPCDKGCSSQWIWRRLYNGINEILEGISLSDAISQKTEL